MIFADEGQISQILINLIKNALQAGARHIDITAKMGKDDEVIIQVANDGEPIPVSAQEQIFIPFYTTKKEGSGIGLSLARQIMRNHNGSIELLRSDANQTVFELIFR
jgi:signal transduction histidine kinase